MMPAYASENGVDPARKTETLAEMTVAVDTWRWDGVPFVLRSGKALGDPRQEIVFTFRDVPHLPTGFSGPSRQAKLRIGINPAVLDLDLVTNGRDDPFDLEWDTMHAEFAASELKRLRRGSRRTARRRPDPLGARRRRRGVLADRGAGDRGLEEERRAARQLSGGIERAEVVEIARR